MKKKKKKDNIILSIGVLVSNRRDTIRQCLDSLTPIREAVPSELILIDTGCDEDVHAILEEYGDKVATFEWCNDFSKARNESLRYATGEWFLYLDDDEWFVDTKQIVDFFASGDYRKYGYASYIQRNFLDMAATQYTDSWVSRMSRRWPDLHFESKIHEYMEPMKGNCSGLKSYVHHFGYVYEKPEDLQKHYVRNRDLLLEMIEEEPENLRWRIHLAQEYRSVKENKLLYELGEEGLALTKDRNGMYDNISISAFYGAKITALNEEDRYEEMLAVCQEADADKRMTELCQTYTAREEAYACFFLGRYEECIRHINRYFEWKAFWEKNEPLLFLQKAVPFAGECMDIVKIKESYSLRICAGLKLGDTGYLKQDLKELHWEEPHVYVFEEMVPTLIEAMCTLPPEEIFEEVLRVMYSHAPFWEYVCEQMTEYEQAGHRVTPMMDLIRKVIPEAVMTEQEALAEDVKRQLRQLIANGMQQQAKEILPQVLQLLPGDKELEEIEKQLSE